MKSPIYLDHAASTPTDPSVRRVLISQLKNFGNPGSTHSFGQLAIGALDHARETALRALGIDPAARFREVVFTGSATEANNLAFRGSIREHGWTPKIIISAVEHDSVYETAMDLKNSGVDVVVVPVDANGAVDISEIERAIDDRTVLVSVMYVNNETGVIQPVKKISELIRNARGTRRYPLFHVDAVQAFAYLDCNPDVLGADLMTLSGHKIGGPKGVGMLYVRASTPKLKPVVTGGGQEFGVRSGTEAVPTIAALATALTVTSSRRAREAKRVGALRDKLFRGIKKIIPAVERNGAGELSPHILNVRFPYHSAADLVVRFDQVGIAVSAGSACAARSPQPSRVIGAMHPNDPRAAHESIRFSLGATTTPDQVSEVLRRLGSVFPS